MKYYIPRTINLPFGYKIKVKQLLKKAWKAAYREAFNDNAHDETAAFCTPEETGATIVLQHNRTPKERKEDLIHELQHAMVEYGEYVKSIE